MTLRADLIVSISESLVANGAAEENRTPGLLIESQAKDTSTLNSGEQLVAVRRIELRLSA
jgi:hypothetical protein